MGDLAILHGAWGPTPTRERLDSLRSLAAAAGASASADAAQDLKRSHPCASSERHRLNAPWAISPFLTARGAPPPRASGSTRFARSPQPQALPPAPMPLRISNDPTRVPRVSVIAST